MSTSNTPIDLSAFDPDRDPDAEARMIGNILAGRRVHYPLSRSRLGASVLLDVWALDRRAVLAVLAAAASITIVVERVALGTPRAPVTVAEAIGVPPMYLARGAAR
ncbi:MAG: hypothetical protein K2X99_08360 [Gemmatimonadaceae bacterium]|nr:hypothetical protein [Gemmatimonadaceae bacterium]